MRLLIDECLPRALKRHFVGHDCQTVRDMDWDGRTNGALLNLAQSKFDVLVTIDQGMQYEQNIAGRSIAILVLLAPSNKIEDLIPIISRTLSDLETIKPGTVRRVS